MGIAHVPTDMNISRGLVKNAIHDHKFGFNADVGTSWETVWSNGGLYPYPAGAAIMTVASANSVDSAAGTGAQTVKISGLDTNYIEIEETVSTHATNGQLGISTINSYLRIHRVQVMTAGSGEKNAGEIYVGTGSLTNGKPAIVHGAIAIGDNQSTQCVYTVPAGKTLYLGQIDYATTNSGGAGKATTVALFARKLGEVFQVKEKLSSASGIYTHKHNWANEFTEKTDIEARAISEAATTSQVSAQIEFMIIDHTPNVGTTTS